MESNLLRNLEIKSNHIKNYKNKLDLKSGANKQMFCISKDLVKFQKKVFNVLPISYKMKIKKEKAKFLLGEKTNRSNLELSCKNKNNLKG